MGINEYGNGMCPRGTRTGNRRKRRSVMNRRVRSQCLVRSDWQIKVYGALGEYVVIGMLCHTVTGNAAGVESGALFRESEVA